MHAMGLFYFGEHDYPRALEAFEQSIVFAHASGRYHIENTISWVARVHSKRRKGLRTAIALYEWCCRLSPAPLDHMAEKYRCLLRLKRLAQVEAARSLDENASLTAIGEATAANFAIEDMKEVRRLAELGLSLAVSQSDRHWQLPFSAVLDSSREEG